MTPRLRLLIVGPTPPPYHGVAMAIETLLYSKLREVFEVLHLDLADRRGIAHVNRPDLHDVRLFVAQWFVLIRLLFRKRPDVTYLVLSQSTVGFLRDSFFLWAAWLIGSRLVVHLHGGALQEWYRSRWFPMRVYVRLVMARATKAIVLGDSLRGAFASLVPSERIAVVPNGIADFDEKTDRLSAKPLLHLQWQVLHLNTLNRMKGSLVLLAAIPAVLRARRDVGFVFAGPWSHEDHRVEAEQFIAQHGLEAFVTFTGQVAGMEKLALLRSADLFVFPGIQQEGQPLVVLEAMAAGLPILFTDQGCLRETVVDGEAGLEVATNDPFDLADRILWLLDHPQECRRLGENARRRGRTFFNRDRHIDKMIEVLEEAANESSAARPTPLMSPHHRGPHP